LLHHTLLQPWSSKIWQHLRYRPIVGNKMPHKTVESSSFYELYLFLSNDLECARVFKVLRFALVHGRIVGLPLLAGQLLHVVPLSTNLFKRDSFILKNHFPTSAFTKLIFNLQCLKFCFNIPIIYSMPILYSLKMAFQGQFFLKQF